MTSKIQFEFPVLRGFRWVKGPHNNFMVMAPGMDTDPELALCTKTDRPRKRRLGCTNWTEAYRLRTSGVTHTGQHCPSSVQPCRSFEAMSELWSLFLDTSSDVILLPLPSGIETAESPLASTQSSMTTYVLATRAKVQFLFWRRLAPCTKPKNKLSINWNGIVHQVSFDV